MLIRVILKRQSHILYRRLQRLFGVYMSIQYISKSFILVLIIFFLNYMRRMSCTSITELRMTPTDVMNPLSDELDFHIFSFNKDICQRYLTILERNRVHSCQIDCDDEISSNVGNKFIHLYINEYWIYKILYILFWKIYTMKLFLSFFISIFIYIICLYKI